GLAETGQLGKWADVVHDETYRRFARDRRDLPRSAYDVARKLFGLARAERLTKAVLDQVWEEAALRSAFRWLSIFIHGLSGEGAGLPGTQVVVSGTAVIELADGGFALHGAFFPLTGRPLAMLRVLLKSFHRSATADHLREEMKINDQEVTYPEQVILDTASKLRAALTEAARAAGLEVKNPLPSVGSGEDLTYRLGL